MLFSYVALWSLSATLFARSSPLFNAKRSIDLEPCLQPNLTDVPPWSPDELMETYLQVNKTKRISYFWSGKFGNESALKVAESCAEQTNPMGATLSMAMCRTGEFTMPSDKAYGDSQAARDRWQAASYYFADYAEKVVYTLSGTSSVTSIWLRVELPKLRDNRNIVAILQLTELCRAVCYWHCPNLVENPNCNVGLWFLFSI